MTPLLTNADQTAASWLLVACIVAFVIGCTIVGLNARRDAHTAEDAGYDALRSPGMGDPKETTPIYDGLVAEAVIADAEAIYAAEWARTEGEVR